MSPIPSPRKDESKDDFISRAISTLAHEDPSRDNDQNVAIAHDSWRKKSIAKCPTSRLLFDLVVAHQDYRKFNSCEIVKCCFDIEFELYKRDISFPKFDDELSSLISKAWTDEARAAALEARRRRMKPKEEKPPKEPKVEDVELKRRKTKLVDDIAGKFEEDDRKMIRETLQFYKFEDLEGVTIEPASIEEFKDTLGVDLSKPENRLTMGGGWYEWKTKTIYLNPITPVASNIHHEMGHAVYYEKFEYGHSPEISTIWTSSEKMVEIKKVLGSYCDTNPNELAAEGFEFLCLRPDVVEQASYLAGSTGNFFKQILKDTGYTLRRK